MTRVCPDHTASERALIGVSASLHDFGDYGGVGVQRPLLAAGGLPLTLPQLPEAIGPALDAIDAILLAPGRDIEPRRYGQDPHALLAETEPQRDEFELQLASAALERLLVQMVPLVVLLIGLHWAAIGGSVPRS